MGARTKCREAARDCASCAGDDVRFSDTRTTAKGKIRMAQPPMEDTERRTCSLRSRGIRGKGVLLSAGKGGCHATLNCETW